MKKKYKIIFIICGIFIAIFLVANILIGVYAPRIVEQQIEQNLKLKASLGKISLSPPFTITLERLELGNLASIKSISLSPNLAALLFGKIVIHGLTIIEPVINLEQSADGKLNLPVLEQKGKPPAIYLTSFDLRNGKIIFTDKKITTEGFQVIINKLNVKVAKVALPITSLATNFSVSAELLSHQTEAFGEITFSGWLDYLAKDLDAKLEVKGLDLAKFSVYYGNFISSRKLISARLDLVSDFKAKNNVLRIASKLNLSHLVYEDELEQPLNLDLMKNALDLFTDTKGNLSLEFNIDTLLDKPELSQEKIQKIILKAAAKNLANQPPDQLIDKVANVIDQYKDLGKGLKAIFGK
jgi:uncharacterized protein involved in outer membrane biogenesis